MTDVFKGYDMSVLEQFYHGEIAEEGDEKAVKILKKTDLAIRCLDDRALQRLLFDIDNKELATAMAGLGGRARQMIFDNLSCRSALFIAEDLIEMKAVPREESAKSAMNILRTLVELIHYGNIVDDEVLNAIKGAGE